MDEEEGTSTDDKHKESDEDEYEGFAFIQDDVLCSICDMPVILKSWILLHSQSTVDVFCKPKLLSNIRDFKLTMTLYCNTRKTMVMNKGDLKGYGTVWYHQDGIANIA